MSKKLCVVSVLSILPFLVYAALPSVSDLAWMTGCWASDGREAGSGEIWMAPAGGMMLGMSRSVRDGKASGYEFLRISEEPDGRIVFVASPSNQDSATFTLVEHEANRAVFENPEHDFPQRIIYSLISASKLLGRIEGSIGGEFKGIDFPMTKTSCE